MTRAQWAALITAVGLGLPGVACDDTWRGVQKDTRENAAIAKQKAADAHLDEKAAVAAEKAREAAATAKHGLENVARDIQQTADRAGSDRHEVDTFTGKAKARTQELGDEARAAALHVNVKQALLRDSSLDASHVNVDVDADRRTVVLRGSVPTLEQKVAAQRVAASHAEGFAIRNELGVSTAD